MDSGSGLCRPPREVHVHMPTAKNSSSKRLLPTKLITPPLNYHQPRPHPVPPRTAVIEPFRVVVVVVVVVVCPAAPDMPTWHACRTRTTRQGNNDHNDDDRGKGGTTGRASTQNTRTHLFDPIPFHPCYCGTHLKRSQRLFGQRRAPAQPNPAQRLRPKPPGLVRGSGRAAGGGKGLPGRCGDGGRAVPLFLAAAVAGGGTFTARRPNGEPTAALAGGVPRQFLLGLELAPLIEWFRRQSARPPFFLLLALKGLVWWKRWLAGCWHAAFQRQRR